VCTFVLGLTLGRSERENGGNTVGESVRFQGLMALAASLCRRTLGGVRHDLYWLRKGGMSSPSLSVKWFESLVHCTTQGDMRMTTIRTFIVAACCSLLLLGAVTAHAGFNLNGLNLNGLNLNGLSLNGLSLNGYYMNGLNVNGTSLPTTGLDFTTISQHGLGK
jgi:hypothetical protein